jgi:Tfp pilus assembly PilM family ATPase
MHGTEKDPRTQKVLISELERGLRELHTVITRYEESSNTTIDKVILSGSGALLQGFATYTADMFSRPVVLADPFSKVAYPAFLEDTLKTAGPSFAVAVGVALSAFQKEH